MCSSLRVRTEKVDPSGRALGVLEPLLEYHSVWEFIHEAFIKRTESSIDRTIFHGTQKNAKTAVVPNGSLAK